MERPNSYRIQFKENILLNTEIDKERLSEVSSQSDRYRKEFLSLVESIRPRLHRYCYRMTKSVTDGEDIVQDTLAQAFYKLNTLQDLGRMESWVFKIAHNKSMDFLRRERENISYDSWEEDVNMSDIYNNPPQKEASVSDAFTALITQLPPKERACILLKEVMDFPLKDIAEIVDSTTGGVKAALHRGREKLEKLRNNQGKTKNLELQQENLVSTYLKLFNTKDWAGVEKLIRADATLEIVGFSENTGIDHIKQNYFVNYSRLEPGWKLKIMAVDGIPRIVTLRYIDDQWIPSTILELTWEDNNIVKIKDYVHVDYLLQDAEVSELNA